MPQKKQIKNNMRKHMSTYKRNSPTKLTGDYSDFIKVPDIKEIEYNAKVDISEAEKNVVDPKIETPKIGESSNDAKLSSDPKKEYANTFDSWALRSAWKDAKMAARKMKRTGSTKADINEYLKTAAGDIARISKTQREKNINPKFTAVYKKSAMKMLFKDKK